MDMMSAKPLKEWGSRQGKKSYGMSIDLNYSHLVGATLLLYILSGPDSCSDFYRNSGAMWRGNRGGRKRMNERRDEGERENEGENRETVRETEAEREPQRGREKEIGREMDDTESESEMGRRENQRI